jgi:hypothetical protein
MSDNGSNLLSALHPVRSLSVSFHRHHILGVSWGYYFRSRHVQVIQARDERFYNFDWFQFVR